MSRLPFWSLFCTKISCVHSIHTLHTESEILGQPAPDIIARITGCQTSLWQKEQNLDRISQVKTRQIPREGRKGRRQLIHWTSAQPKAKGLSCSGEETVSRTLTHFDSAASIKGVVLVRHNRSETRAAFWKAGLTANGKGFAPRLEHELNTFKYPVAVVGAALSSWAKFIERSISQGMQ